MRSTRQLISVIELVCFSYDGVAEETSAAHYIQGQAS